MLSCTGVWGTANGGRHEDVRRARDPGLGAGVWWLRFDHGQSRLRADRPERVLGRALARPEGQLELGRAPALEAGDDLPGLEQRTGGSQSQPNSRQVLPHLDLHDAEWPKDRGVARNDLQVRRPFRDQQRMDRAAQS
ncbi:MAG: hypothetical protein US42_C0011G0037 [Candidatus Magasanikbacteria bacterium GW2011_GWC2_37_14]|uniref:Uncharacterized protein n=1 Tax=Candidatus Magasanikbacteria bacterium GW2011_GWC2_37_14 TaxID=1619046 RepID=A0A0G0IT15_9BACT|nr:MAG: hypothetical protein US42_C0011G0037 [Candidatus Magasanikbacteria bacterium GW2011_GWC2_37_14]